MAKTSRNFTATITLNTEKGGAWLTTYTLTKEQNNGLGGFITVVVDENVIAWKNASAAKRWIKAKVQELTPRKSVKLVATKFDTNEKPTAFKGELTYKE